MNVPVLVLIFNRPEFIPQLMEQISRYGPSTVYIAADGPRERVPGEAISCEKARQAAVTSVSSPRVETRFSRTNQGCGRAVSEAIAWFFEHEEMGIILEDDCYPDASFFTFSEQLLHRFRNEEKVKMVSGNNFVASSWSSPNSYRFSRYTNIWGWASWRRAWKDFDYTMSDWPALRNTKWLLDICEGDKREWRYWRKIFDRVYRNEIDTWDYRWTWSLWKSHGLSVVPSKNLVQNLGFGPSATHTKSAPRWLSKVEVGSAQFPLVHPEELVPDQVADRENRDLLFGAESALTRVFRKAEYFPLPGAFRRRFPQ